ncbi:DUF3267 domain-containing protein [Raoultibacter massiliensis]|uniref:DUF3267 domain-containing protein n=1 Tax=Raoultibacter massiliensis TaxID=1852371 RepID=A0ABV1JBY4_9ACTN|nr:DUF3267 domain-containing protein [Raoultibacter massiliensis]
MQNEERKLTPAELKRKEEFEETEAAFAMQGYRKERLTMGIVAANIFALGIALPIDIVLGIAFFAIHPAGSLTFDFAGALGVLAAFIVLIVVHELIHGLVWSLYAKGGRKAISFGFIVEYLTPYCSCSEPLPKHAYIIGALAPTVVLGLLPVLASYALGSIPLFAVGALMIIGGGGDMAIVLKLLRFKPEGTEVLLLDHPYELGLAAFVK